MDDDDDDDDDDDAEEAAFLTEVIAVFLLVAVFLEVGAEEVEGAETGAVVAAAIALLLLFLS